MSWMVETHADGGLLIRHLARPRFTARWTTGEFPLQAIAGGAFFWTDEGAGEEDTIHLYSVTWTDPPPGGGSLEGLMGETVRQIEKAIMGRA